MLIIKTFSAKLGMRWVFTVLWLQYLPWDNYFEILIFLSLYADVSLKMENLKRAIQGMKNWYRFGWWLDVPRSKRDEIKKSISALEDQREALLQEWLEHHPCPNWRLFAWALLRRQEAPEHEMLMQLYGNYIPGIVTPLPSSALR